MVQSISNKIIELDVYNDKLIPNPENRKHEDKEEAKKKLGKLQKSILRIGLQSAITVKKSNDGFEIVAGHRRINALKTMNGYIEASIIEAKKIIEDNEKVLNTKKKNEEKTKAKEKIEDATKDIEFFTEKQKDLSRYSKIVAIIQEYESEQDARLALIATNVVSAEMDRKDKAAMLLNLANSGMSERKIAATLGIAKTTVHDLIQYGKEIDSGKANEKEKPAIKETPFEIENLEDVKRTIADIKSINCDNEELEEMTQESFKTLRNNVKGAIVDLQNAIQYLKDLDKKFVENKEQAKQKKKQERAKVKVKEEEAKKKAEEEAKQNRLKLENDPNALKTAIK